MLEQILQKAVDRKNRRKDRNGSLYVPRRVTFRDIGQT